MPDMHMTEWPLDSSDAGAAHLLRKHLHEALLVVLQLLKDILVTGSEAGHMLNRHDHYMTLRQHAPCRQCHVRMLCDAQGQR